MTFVTLFRDTRRARMANWSPDNSLDGDEIPADTPTSTRALAEALDLPYDTVRRHLRKLRRMGWCESTSEGVFIPLLGTADETLRTAVDQLWRLVRDFATLSARMGAFPSPAKPILSRDARFQIARVAIDYFVDSLTMARRRLGLSPIECVVLRALTSRNLRTLSQTVDAPSASHELSADGAAMPRAPISVYAVSKTLSLPYETVRRTANHLIATGWAERTEDRGLKIPAAIWTSEAPRAYVAEYAPLTAAFLARLAWIDAQMAAGRPAGASDDG